VDGIIDTVVRQFGKRAIAGDAVAARVMLAAAERQAAVRGTDSGPLGSVPWIVDSRLGGICPDDVPPEAREAMFAGMVELRPESARRHLESSTPVG
jgi:hypothetical protein